MTCSELIQRVLVGQFFNYLDFTALNRETRRTLFVANVRTLVSLPMCSLQETRFRKTRLWFDVRRCLTEREFFEQLMRGRLMQNLDVESRCNMIVFVT
jgi:hypothetical protein